MFACGRHATHYSALQCTTTHTGRGGLFSDAPVFHDECLHVWGAPVLTCLRNERTCVPRRMFACARCVAPFAVSCPPHAHLLVVKVTMVGRVLTAARLAVRGPLGVEETTTVLDEYEYGRVEEDADEVEEDLSRIHYLQHVTQVHVFVGLGLEGIYTG